MTFNDINPAFLKEDALGDYESNDDDDEATKTGKRKERLEQNRISARESRKRKKNMIEELQRTVITLSRDNKELNERNEALRRELVEIGTKNPGVVNIQALMSCSGTGAVAEGAAVAGPAVVVGEEGGSTISSMNNVAVPADRHTEPILENIPAAAIPQQATQNSVLQQQVIQQPQHQQQQQAQQAAMAAMNGINPQQLAMMQQMMALQQAGMMPQMMGLPGMMGMPTGAAAAGALAGQQQQQQQQLLQAQQQQQQQPPTFEAPK